MRDGVKSHRCATRSSFVCIVSAYVIASSAALAQDGSSVGFVGDLSGFCATDSASHAKDVFADQASQRGHEVHVVDTGCSLQGAASAVELLMNAGIDFIFVFTESPPIGNFLKDRLNRLELESIVFIAVQPNESGPAASASAAAWADVLREFGDGAPQELFSNVNPYLQRMFWSRFADD